MKLAVLVPEFPRVSETFIINQILGFKKKGFDVDIISINKPRFDFTHELVKESNLYKDVIYIDQDRFHCCLYKIIHIFLDVFYIVFFKKNLLKFLIILFDFKFSFYQKYKMIKILRHGRFDDYLCTIVHFGCFGYFAYKMRSLGLISGNIAVFFHGYDLSVRSVVTSNLKQYRVLFKHVEYILPISEYWKNKLVSLGCPLQKISVHRMGIFPQLYNGDRNVSFDKIQLVQVGRLVDKKAVLDSISAVVFEHKVGIPIEFDIIGDGPLFIHVKKCIQEKNASEYIHLLGAQSQEFVADKLAHSNVFILPSVTAANGDKEGIPVSLMEAMASSLLVISTFHSGIPELIEDGVTGYLVPEHSPELIAEKLSYIYSASQDKLDMVRMNARKKVETDFNNNILYDELVNLTLNNHDN